MVFGRDLRCRGLAVLECADLSALWYAATCRRKAGACDHLAATSRRSGNKLPHSKLITLKRFALPHFQTNRSRPQDRLHRLFALMVWFSSEACWWARARACLSLLVQA